MSIAAWRRLLIGFCAVATLQIGVTVWMLVTGFGALGTATAPTSPFYVVGSSTTTPFLDRVTVPPDGPAYRAGLRTGDLVDLRALPAAQRYRWLSGYGWAGERVSVPVVRANGIQWFSIAAELVPVTWDLWLGIVGATSMILFAALLAWRRADSAEARTLSVLLTCIAVGNALLPINWITKWATLDAAVGVLSEVFYYAGFALFATYAMLFAAPAARLRRTLAWLSYFGAAVTVLYGLAYVAGSWTLTADPAQAWYTSAIPQIVTGVFPYLFPLLCALVSVAGSRGPERARITWAVISLGALFAIYIVAGTIVAFDPQFSSRIVLYAENLMYFVAPIGLAYSLLNRRLLDIGFAINRAAVFSGVSVIVVGLFVLAEWLFGTWFSSASRTENLAVSAAIALVLGISVRAIHSRVNHVLDQVFFRKRHEDERALRTFAYEAAYITDPSIVLRRATAALEEHADASFVTFALDDGAGRYGDVSENDPAIVALRAWHKELDLHGLETALTGEFAYPMRARGRLVGALVVGAKRSGDSYAPDESEAIAQLAHGVGGALDILSANKENQLEALAEAVRALPAAIANLLKEDRQKT